MNYQLIELDVEQPSHTKIKIKVANNTDGIQPILELYKGKIYTALVKTFTNDCIVHFGVKIFSVKKSVSRTLTNLLSSWIFSLYIDYDFMSDYFFPTNYTNTKILEDTIRDLCKYDPQITNIDEKLGIVLGNLQNRYQTLLTDLAKYKESALFKNNKNNYKIKKYIIQLNNKESHFYKLSISINFNIKDKRLINILNNILIPVKIYDKLSGVYTGPPHLLNDYLWGIIFRYQLLGSNNHQLAVLPKIMNEMNKDYNLNFECFASTINSTFKNYCSIYYDLEKYFGSVGSFFNMTPIKGTLGVNPPYQKEIIDMSIKKILKCLDETTEPLTFIITIPIWDSKGQSLMREQFNNILEKQYIDYGDFEIVNLMEESKYFKSLRMVPKEEFTYIDHNFELYKNKTIQNTYVIFLSNQEIDTTQLNSYNFA